MKELWEETQNSLRKQLSEENYDTWLAPVRCDGIEEDTLKLRIPNRFYADWLSVHYQQLILTETIARSGKPVTKIEWVVDETLQEELPKPVAQPEITPKPEDKKATPAPEKKLAESSSDLNPKYQFGNFVVGPSNQLAHAASVAVGDAPGKRYNPLFLYGGVGLGKTHLMNAMGHKVLQDKPDANIVYVSAERFTNDFIWSLQNHRIDEFRKRYRENCDLLLMDDIQFLAGREQTQEEFFHTFNALYHQDKQIVVTSDVYPQQIQEMEERLISRFQSGMVADVQPPEIDTRVAILQKKAEAEGINLPSDVAHYLAQVVKSNVRELEGTLLRLAVKCELLGKPIDLTGAKESMRGVLASPEVATSIEDIQKAVCAYFGIRLSDMKGKRRHRAVSQPRQLAMFMCRERLGTSYPELGDRFGGKDHTTVISAVRKVTSLIKNEDDQVITAIEVIDRKLGL